MEKVPGRATWHSLSFGAYYDPDRTRIGTMVCHDEHLLAEGQGFADHAHDGVDIVSVVITGAVRHEDSTGSSSVLEAGGIGWLHTGAGVRHSEIAAAPQTRFVQVWLRSDGAMDSTGAGTAEADVPQWQRVDGDELALPGGTLRVLRLGAGEDVELPVAGDDEQIHLFVAAGALARNSIAEPLGAGDAMTLDAADARAAARISTAVPTTVLVWTVAAESRP